MSCTRATWEHSGLCGWCEAAALPGLCAVAPGLPPRQHSGVPCVCPPQPVDGSAQGTSPQLLGLSDGAWPSPGGSGHRWVGVEKV